MIGLYGRQLEAERVSSLAAIAAASDSGSRPATDTLAAAAFLRDVLGLPKGETGAASAAVAAAAAVTAADKPASCAGAGFAYPALYAATTDMMPGGNGGGGVGGVDGGVGGGGAGGGGESGVGVRALLPATSVAAADEAPEGTESVRRLPPGPFVVDSGGDALRVPSAIDSVAATAATADATIITGTATATVDRGAGTVSDRLPE